MTTTAAGAQSLRYFIHDDFDAFRMEVSGSLAGSAASTAYEAWRVARLLARRARLVVDVSYVTRVDEYGEAVLQAWQKQEVQIVASSPASLAIVNSIPRTPVPSAPRTLGGFLAQAANCRKSGKRRRAGIISAESKQENVENTGFRLLTRMEPQVR